MTDTPSLPPGALALLPDAGATIRCAEYSESVQLDPGGTAICADAVILIETPLPWPKPVFAHGQLTGLMSMVDTVMGPARVLAAVPVDDTDLRVIVYQRTPTGAAGTVHRPGDSVAFVGSLEHTSPLDLPHEPAPEGAVLICTQGSHDICCGAEGVALAIEADARLDVPVHRVSHTGGHRFAPTAMTLPDGRMWAYLNGDDLVSIINRADTSDVTDRCRGWWGASTGPAQMAERAVFATAGPTFDEQERQVEVVEDGAGWMCTVTSGDRTWQVQIEVGRIVPTIKCRELGGLPAKPGREFKVSAIAAS